MLAFALGGCSLFDVKSTHQSTNSPQIRDVPFAARTDPEIRKRVIVLPFIDSSIHHSEQIAAAARQALLKGLIKSDRVVLVNPADLPQDLARLRNDQEYNLEAVSRLASALGVAAVIEGKIMEIKARKLSDEVGLIRKVHAKLETTIRLRIYSSKTAKEILNEMRTGEIESSTTRFAQSPYSDRNLEDDPKLVEDVVAKAFQGAMPEVIRTMGKLSWEGRIAMVQAEKVYINAGRLSGIQVGDILKVTEDGEDIFDPDTGALIGKVPGRMKGTLEVISYFGQDGAVSVIHSGAGFHENDRVELY